MPSKPTEEEIVFGILRSLSEAKAQKITRYQVSRVVSYADEIIITTGMSSTHVKSLVSKVEKYCKSIDFKPFSKIRKRESYDWIVLDYHYIIIHLFQESTRSYYNLDSFFQKALPLNYWEVYES